MNNVAYFSLAMVVFFVVVACLRPYNQATTLGESDKLKQTIERFFAHPTQQTKRSNSSTEDQCRRMIESIFNNTFTKVRPPWLRNPVTNRCLELDMYNEDLKLAFEYDGAQHKHFTPHFHGCRDHFEYRKLLDTLKTQLCEDAGVLLVRIPYYIKSDDLLSYLIGVSANNNRLATLMGTLTEL
jgi:hypothetical protein